MFGNFKEKLKSWLGFSKEKVEEKEAQKEKPLRSKKEKKEKKVKEIKEKVVKESIKKIPQKTPQTVAEAVEENKKTQQIAQDIEEDFEKVDQLILKAKEEDHLQAPLIIEGKHAYPDVEKIKQETTHLHTEIESAKKREQVKKEEEEVKKILHPQDEKKSFFSKIKAAFTYTITESEFNEIFENLEFLLLENNVAYEVVEALQKKLAQKLIGKEIKRDQLETEIKKELRLALEELIIDPDNPLDMIKLSPKPFVILFFGINGTGKTTSIAKVAHFLKKSKFSVVLAAADTFRAASIEQLAEHARRLDVPIIKHDYGTDPASVGFDAIKYAKNHKIDVVLIDTAGRMHTKTNLIEEMKKIERVNKPNLKIFVAESIAGNDATEQAKTFHEAIEIDGSILSKADIDEKGGTVISVSFVTQKPIFYLGTGQNYEDLQLFNKEKFIESLGL